MFFKIIVKEVKRKIRNRTNYWKNELRYKMKGDNRDAFTKKVHKCKYLELTDMIHNWGKKESAKNITTYFTGQIYKFALSFCLKT